MDLFVVNRYEGEEKAVQNEPQSKLNHLEKLLSKIEEKKREAEHNQLQSILTKDNVKKKKSAQKQDSQISQEDKSFKQKKKKKHERQESRGAVASPKIKRRKHGEHSSEKQSRENENDKEGTPSLEDLNGQFTILGNDSFEGKRAKVDSALPHWLAHPSVVSVDLQNLTVSINDIPQLNPKLINKLKKNGITHFFPVQHQVIPWLLEVQSNPPQFWPRDVCVSAPTGSGKTLAYVLPIIQALHDRAVPEIRALVVVPVQALALQVFSVFQEYTTGTFLRVGCTTGMDPFQEEQAKLIRYSEADKRFHSRVDILVTTPGRLVDHLQLTEGFSLQHLKYLVIDEADRVLKSMQQDWLYHLERHICQDDKSRRGAPPLTIRDMCCQRPPPQKLLFSATLTQDPEKLKQLGLFQPRLFSSIVNATHAGETSKSFIGKFSTPAELKEQWISCEPTVKPLYLLHLLKSRNWNQALVFANSNNNVHRLTILMRHLLDSNITIAEVSSSLPIKERRDVFRRFSTGKINVLVSSDSLARGIDIPSVECVILYNAPGYIQNYIHRIGRTGRAGRAGTAITLVEPRQVEMFKKMLDRAGKEGMAEESEIDSNDLEPMEDKFKEALSALKWELEEEADKKKATLVKAKKTAAKMRRFAKTKKTKQPS